MTKTEQPICSEDTVRIIVRGVFESGETLGDAEQHQTVIKEYNSTLLHSKCLRAAYVYQFAVFKSDIFKFESS